MPTHYPHNSKRIPADRSPRHRRRVVQWLAGGAGVGFLVYAVVAGFLAAASGSADEGVDAAAYAAFGAVGCVASRGPVPARGYLLWGGLLAFAVSISGLIGSGSATQVCVSVGMIAAAAMTAPRWC